MVSTLNKIIALFLTGGLALFLACCFHWPQLSKLLMGQPSSDSRIWVALGLIFIPVTAATGAVFTGLSEVSIQRIVKRSASSRYVARLLGRRRAARNLDYWRGRLQELASTDASLSWIKNQPKADAPWLLEASAIGNFHCTARPETFSWLVEDYSTFLLAANLAFVLAAGVAYLFLGSIAARLGLWWPVVIPIEGSKVVLLLIAALGGIWSLCSLAAGRYLYCCEVFCRQLSLWLSDSRLSGVVDLKPGKR